MWPTPSKPGQNRPITYQDYGLILACQTNINIGLFYRNCHFRGLIWGNLGKWYISFENWESRHFVESSKFFDKND